MAIEHAGLSDVGMRRDHNEDALCLNPEYNLYIVCDGMGGHAAGEVASRIAVETVEKFTAATSNDSDITWPFEYDEHLTLNANRIRTAIRLANQNLIAHIQERKEFKGMGTTIVCSLISGDEASLGHVGDSRIYMLRNSEIQQITRDHSWIDEQLKQGILTPEEARKHPLRNVITRALGSKEDVVVDVLDVKLRDGDILLLCSDGLTGMLEDHEIRDVVLARRDDLKGACKALVDNANAHGGDDNVTVILLRYRADRPHEAAKDDSAGAAKEAAAPEAAAHREG